MTKYFSSINRNEQKDESSPLDISEIMQICREFSNLGFNIQNQIEYILENGILTSLSDGKINKSHLPFIKQFLLLIKDNFYFGDASYQASDIIDEISKIEKTESKVLN